MNKLPIISLAIISSLATFSALALITTQITNNLESRPSRINTRNLEKNYVHPLNNPKLNNPTTVGNPSPDIIDIDGRQDYTIEVDGVEREFVVYRPASLADDIETPVVFMFHGSGGTGEKMYENTGWKDAADAEGLTIVYPTALKFHVFSDEKVVNGDLRYDVAAYQTKWNEFNLASNLDPDYPDQVLMDDIHFTQAMVTFMKESYPVDHDRFYSTGFSNGANFSSRTCVQMHDIFAACAIVGAGLITPANAALTDEYTDAAFVPRPLFVTLGEKDPKITNALGVETIALDESIASDDVLLKQIVVNPYLDRLDLANTYDYAATDYLSHFRYHTATSGNGAQEFNLMIVKGAGHIYPDGNNHPLDIVDTYWPFFEQFTL